MKLLVFAVILIISTTSVFAQAVDPDCWYPKVGEGIDIDDHDMSIDHDFGNNLVRLQNPSDSSYYLACIGYRDNLLNHTVFHSPNPLDIHHLSLFKKLNIDLSKMKFGHFRDAKHLDALGPGELRTYGCPIIYWADENGMYDTTRYTILWSSVQGDYGPEVGAGFSINESFIGHITNDSLDDIMYLGGTRWKISVDSSKAYVFFFHGGAKLYNNDGGHVLSDSSFYYSDPQLLFGTAADFTGDGKTDWIVSDTKGNMLLYRSQTTFSIQNFVDQIKHDTLIAAWQNPMLVDSENLWGLSNRFAIAGLPRKPGDKSVDFVPSLFTVGYPSSSYWFFRGGPDFGTHRLLLDSAEIIITNPGAIDGTFSGIDVSGPEAYDAGDLTGTGRPVMKAGGAFGHDQAFEFYYVLGDAIDEKIDIIISHPHGTGSGAIKVDADGDKYGDIIYQANSEYDQLTPKKSGLWVLHGSEKIPVHINPKYAGVAKPNSVQSDCYAFPNPADISTTLRFSVSNSGNLTMSILDILGRTIDKRAVLAESGLTSFQIPLDHISNGIYIVRLENDKEHLATKIIVSH